MEPLNPLRVAFAREHPGEFAALLAAQPQAELVEALDGLPADAGAGVVARLPPPVMVKLLAGRSDDAVSAWLNRAELDDALALLLHLDEPRRGRVLGTMPIRHMRRTLERLVVYPNRTVGALLDPTIVKLQAATGLEQAIELLRAAEYDDLEWIWVVDGEGRYVGLLDLSKALLARSEQYRVGELAVHLEPLRAETALLAARDVSEWLKHPDLPVVDHQHHLLGALSRQRLMQALAGERVGEQGLLDGLTSLTEAYFRMMGSCLGELLGRRERP